MGWNCWVRRKFFSLLCSEAVFDWCDRTISFWQVWQFVWVKWIDFQFDLVLHKFDWRVFNRNCLSGRSTCWFMVQKRMSSLTFYLLVVFIDACIQLPLQNPIVLRLWGDFVSHSCFLIETLWLLFRFPTKVEKFFSTFHISQNSNSKLSSLKLQFIKSTNLPLSVHAKRLQNCNKFTGHDT